MIVDQLTFNTKYSSNYVLTKKIHNNDPNFVISARFYNRCGRLRLALTTISQAIFSLGSVRKTEKWQRRWCAVRYGQKEMIVDITLMNDFTKTMKENYAKRLEKMRSKQAIKSLELLSQLRENRRKRMHDTLGINMNIHKILERNLTGY